MAKKGSAKKRRTSPRKAASQESEAQFQKGDRVRVHMRADWEIVGEVRAVTKDGLRVFDFIMEDVLHVRQSEIARIDSL